MREPEEISERLSAEEEFNLSKSKLQIDKLKSSDRYLLAAKRSGRNLKQFNDDEFENLNALSDEGDQQPLQTPQEREAAIEQDAVPPVQGSLPANPNDTGNSEFRKLPQLDSSSEEGRLRGAGDNEVPDLASPVVRVG